MHQASPAKTPPVPVYEDQMRSLLAATTQARDRALLLVVRDCGVRLGELISMKVGDINWSLQVIYVDGETGPRTVPFGANAARELDRWLRKHTPSPDPTRPFGWKGRPLTGSGVAQLLA